MNARHRSPGSDPLLDFSEHVGPASQVRSANAYSLFEEQGVLPAAAGAPFRDEVLAQSGRRPALEPFIAFRSSSRQSNPLLRHNAMSPS
jgi:oligopeptidase A